MTSLVYSPADSRGWGVGDSNMRGYYLIGGALQPSEIYTVRVREHWRRRRRRAVPAAPVVVAPAAAPRPRARKRAIAIPVAPTRVLRSATRRGVPMDVTPVVPAVPVPAAPSAIAIGAKRRRIS